ncbi:MAG: ABC transporter ATP-binding protein [Limnochordales bacterium]|nr:MAG: high-affinity branched-chain amino acid ABC transporter ATP-binding protein LivG [Bacillota bacterium]
MLLEIKGLNHKFHGLHAVKDVSLQVREGELAGIIGPNGAGKTTVFNLITGVYRPTSGDIRFQGESIVGLTPSAIVRRGIARTFQTIRLFRDLTVLDNVRIAHYQTATYPLFSSFLRTPGMVRREEEIVQRSLELLDVFGLAHLAAEKASSLPYGQQRQLEIARALATEPKLLLLDEPAAGMNPAEVEELSELIKYVQERFNVTILLIEHQMKMVMSICQRLTVLDFGQIIAEGPPEEVRSNQRVLEAYLGRGAVLA